MDDKILFSVVIPTYNRAEKLNKALNSLVDQTYKEFEVLVCDDGSTDNTREVVDSFRYSLNIQYFWEPNWGGPARPRNIGIKHAKAEWVCFLDADDWWHPNKLEACLPFLKENDFIYHYLDIDSVPATKEQLRGRQLKQENTFLDLYINGNAIPNSSAAVRKSVLEIVNGISEDKKLMSVEDYECWLRISKITSRFKLIPESLGTYYVGDGNISVNGNYRIKTHNYLFNKYNSQLDRGNRNLAEFNQVILIGQWYEELKLNFRAAFYYFTKIRPWHLKQTFKYTFRICSIIKKIVTGNGNK